ncbi:hypothetical protein ACWDBW_06735 [Streptomyces sp. NPDC001107]
MAPPIQRRLQRRRGQEPVLTGPAIVDKSDIAAIEKYASKGTR